MVGRKSAGVMCELGRIWLSCYTYWGCMQVAYRNVYDLLALLLNIEIVLKQISNLCSTRRCMSDLGFAQRFGGNEG